MKPAYILWYNVIYIRICSVPYYRCWSAQSRWNNVENKRIIVVIVAD